MHKLHKNSIAFQLVKLIELGEEKTVKEWTEHFKQQGMNKITPNKIYQACKQARRRGYQIYPIGASGFGKDYTAGVLKIVTHNSKDFEETNERLIRNYRNPAILRQFKLLQDYYIEAPHMASLIMAQTEALQFFILSNKKQLSLPNGNANTTNPN